jgi:hypothetical protein
MLVLKDGGGGWFAGQGQVGRGKGKIDWKKDHPSVGIADASPRPPLSPGLWGGAKHALPDPLVEALH